jgi:hypothetical protein
MTLGWPALRWCYTSSRNTSCMVSMIHIPEHIPRTLDFGFEVLCFCEELLFARKGVVLVLPFLHSNCCSRRGAINLWRKEKR